ncbi:MAG: hypothetical protein AAGE38_10550, partial [Pseudomonadota bacterium]
RATMLSGVLFGLVMAIVSTILCAIAGYGLFLCVLAYIFGGALGTVGYLSCAAFLKLPAQRPIRNSVKTLIE